MGKYETLIQEILGAMDGNGEVRPMRRFAVLDLREDSHFQCVMELFGGEDTVRAELPWLYQRALNARQGSIPNDEPTDSTVDHAVICDLSATEDQSIYSFGLSSLKEVAQEIYSTMTLYNWGKRVGRNFSFEFNCHRAELDCLSAPVPELRGGMRSVLHVTWTPMGSDALHSMVLEAETLETVEDPVDVAVFHHPDKSNYSALTPIPLNVPNPEKVIVLPSRKGPKQLSYINVCYDRSPESGESVNYAYGATRVGVRQQRIFLDIRGEFALKEKCRFRWVDNTAVGLELGSVGSALYRSRIDREQNFTISEGNKIFFAFPTDWSVDIPSKKLAGREMSYVDVAIEFTYHDERSQDPSEHTDRRAIVSASSAVSHNPSAAWAGHFVQLDPVKLNWGCVEAGTMVRLADGSEKRICDIRLGDQVWTPDSGRAEVVNICSGDEPELFVLRSANGRELRLTADHPVCIEGSGYKTAADVTPADKLVLEDGTPVEIEALYLVQGGFRVYSLELEGSSIMLCNGYQTGDFHIQGQTMCPSTSMKEPDKALLEEAEKLRGILQCPSEI